ncbi:excalibur calcium-binding domain-containing protein [Paenibacillus cremeus]|uniref:excalibur calcium-binding domain-containing protein n=1 Tax=Paenibacillus cremeus TaxID=2163881 RepID=UPI0021BDAE56|nr:excalibur calcium-binding domain-containing protein [Paenibacillus cremeus]
MFVVDGGKETSVLTATRETPKETPKAPEPASTPKSNIVFKNCTDANKAGYYNIHRGEPGYAPKLDRDNDGIACEK